MAKVVVVENDMDVAPLLEQLLALEGHHAILVMDPIKAMETIRQQQPDLIYLDVHLSREMGIDGFSILKEIRAESQVPVLMCSGLDLEHKCMAAGASAFLLKPFDFADLLRGVAQAIDSQV